MRFVRSLAGFIVTLLVVSAIIGSSYASAEESSTETPWSKSCRHYRSSRHFVTESNVYCLRQANQKVCQAQAHKYFDQCHYTGTFQRIYARVSARMLLVLALSSVRSVHHIDL